MLQVHSLAQGPASANSVEEVFHTLLEHPSGARIEHILSHAQASPKGFWYDQAQDEWVLLLQGEAELEIEGQPMLSLRAGHHVCIPAHVKHRVHSTTEDASWLTVHLGDGNLAIAPTETSGL